jgi:hypothetical protein
VFLYELDICTRHRLQRGTEHLHCLGDRALCEFLLELAHRAGGLPATLALLSEFEERLTPQMIRLVGADRFPSLPLRAVPR